MKVCRDLDWNSYQRWVAVWESALHVLSKENQAHSGHKSEGADHHRVTEWFDECKATRVSTTQMETRDSREAPSEVHGGPADIWISEYGA